MDAPLDARTYTTSYTASAIAYHQLKEWIMLGAVPLGIGLREERIAERLQVSRTPVREALLRLHAESFIERHPEGGYRVANPSVDRTRELYEVRRALELFALRRGFEQSTGHDHQALCELKQEWLTMDIPPSAPDPEFVLLDEDFHWRLARASGNLALSEELRRVNERIRVVRSHDFITPGRITATVDQHVSTIESVLDRRGDVAADLLDLHIRESQAVVEATVGRAFERMLKVGDGDTPW